MKTKRLITRSCIRIIIVICKKYKNIITKRIAYNKFDDFVINFSKTN